MSQSCRLTSKLWYTASWKKYVEYIFQCDGNGPGFEAFKAKAATSNLIPLFERIFSDQLTPVVAYGCLVKEDDREAPSFLLESVVNGDQSVRAVTLLTLYA